MYYKDVTVEVEDPEQVKVYKDSCILISDTLLVFQLDGRVKELMEGELNGQINGISIIHLPIEGGLKTYSENLVDLINYIIFDQQNGIVNDQLFVINKEDAFHNETIKIIQENQKKITKNNYELFPKEDTSCIQADPSTFHVTFPGGNEHQYYFGEFELEVSDEIVELEEGDEIDISGDTYYEYIVEKSSDDEEEESTTSEDDEEEKEPEAIKVEDPNDLVDEEDEEHKLVLSKLKEKAKSQGSGGSVANVKVQEHWKKETYTLALRGIFSQKIGSISSGIQNSENKIIVSRLVNPDYYNIIPDLDDEGE